MCFIGTWALMCKPSATFADDQGVLGLQRPVSARIRQMDPGTQAHYLLHQRSMNSSMWKPLTSMHPPTDCPTRPAAGLTGRCPPYLACCPLLHLQPSKVPIFQGCHCSNWPLLASGRPSSAALLTASSALSVALALPCSIPSLSRPVLPEWTSANNVSSWPKYKGIYLSLGLLMLASRSPS